MALNMTMNRRTINKQTSSIVPLDMEHVDTDQIIPARFLKATDREGFGENLFRDWRFDADDKPLKDFVLNNPVYSGSILVTGKNFGCGSSREHAAWAIKDYGFDIVISSFFADIFRNNAMNNFLLPVQVSETFLHRIFQIAQKEPLTELTVDLPAQTVTINITGENEHFEINEYKKNCLLNGFDDIDFLISIKGEIEAFEKNKSLQHQI
jgi:3-isopropylmalate/(R)-2-methylmalate dehydratase small subunit